MEWLARLNELTADWRHILRRDGWRSALPEIGRAIATLPYRRMRFSIITRSLTEPLPEWHPKITLEIRPFEQTDLASVRKIDRPSEANLCARRLARGHCGLVACHNGQVAGYAWGCTEVDPALERVHLKLDLGDVLCADVYTAPSLRGQGVQTALVLARFQLFHDLGYRRAVTYIEKRNSPSLAVWQRKLGSQTIGEVDFIRIGPWYRVHYTYESNTIEATTERFGR